MDLLKIVLIFGLSELCVCLKVYEWRRIWKSGTETREFAQVQNKGKTVVHYSVESYGSMYPAITLHDYKFNASGFSKGIVAIRPLVAEGSQVCFITASPDLFSDAKSEFQSYHGKSLPAVTDKKLVTLMSELPEDLDPLSVNTIRDFCNVDRAHIFYMKKINSLKTYDKRMKIHTTIGLFGIGVPNNFTEIIFDVGIGKRGITLDALIG